MAFKWKDETIVTSGHSIEYGGRLFYFIQKNDSIWLCSI